MDILRMAERLTPKIAVLGVDLRVNHPAWRSNRMVIVSQKKPTKQFRCRFVAGVRLYEQRISAAGGENNYQPVSDLVVKAEWHDFYSGPSVNHSSGESTVVTSLKPKCQAAGNPYRQMSEGPHER
ncbi:hypothetical protein [Pantoea sp.]|uniref:hypothetical protein n=1 Tax=Pantoea sp. TaxID=69393 RepID=UPI0028A998F0|nr:hypothetical protein [Pantoea sp.]